MGAWVSRYSSSFLRKSDGWGYVSFAKKKQADRHQRTLSLVDQVLVEWDNDVVPGYRYEFYVDLYGKIADSFWDANTGEFIKWRRR